jgi:hypothetical protein
MAALSVAARPVPQVSVIIAGCLLSAATAVLSAGVQRLYAAQQKRQQ